MFIKVKVRPKSKKEVVKKTSPNSFLISVREPAERNLANKKVCELIAVEMKIDQSRVRIISGFHSPSKIISIHD